MSANETIADIAAEIREAVECSSDGVIAIKGRYLADRLDAAAKREREQHKRELDRAVLNKDFVDSIKFCAEMEKRYNVQSGNAAAMREALVEISKIADNWEFHGTTKAGALDRIYELAKAALAEPPRNCDVGSPAEQTQRFSDFCHGYGDCDDCPSSLCFRGDYYCSLAWAQMPYEAKEGGAK